MPQKKTRLHSTLKSTRQTGFLADRSFPNLTPVTPGIESDGRKRWDGNVTSKSSYPLVMTNIAMV